MKVLYCGAPAQALDTLLTCWMVADLRKLDGNRPTTCPRAAHFKCSSRGSEHATVVAVRAALDPAMLADMADQRHFDCS